MNIRLYFAQQQILSIILCLGLVVIEQKGDGQNYSCVDSVRTFIYTSSVFQRIGQAESFTTADNGTIISYQKPTKTLPNGNLTNTLVIFRINANNDIMWSKMINERQQSSFSFYITYVHEMKNGNILLFGDALIAGKESIAFTLLMLDAQGDFLWQKIYTANIFIGDGKCSEGNNNEITVCHTGPGYPLNSNQLLVTRLDSTGNLKWSNTYICSSMGITTDGIITSGNSFYISGISQINTTSFSSLWFLQFDYASGNIIISKDYFSGTNFNSWRYFALGGANHLILSSAMQNTFDGTYYEGKTFLQLDSLLEVKKSIAIFPRVLIGTVSPDCLSDQQGNSGWTFYNAYVTSTLYYAVIDSNNNIPVQKKFVPNAIINQAIFNFKKNNELSVVLYNLQNGNYYFQFVTASADYLASPNCGGQDTTFLITHPIYTSLGDISWSRTGINDFTQSKISSTLENFTIITQPYCSQQSICDSIKINGRNEFCLNDSVFTFTATKNNSCLKRTNWLADTSFISSINQINDTTISLQFKNAGSGYLTASIAGCGIADSLMLTVHQKSNNVFIGNDTLLCANATDTLRSSSYYQKYLWQNGSTDSFYVVKNSGTYYLTATDMCNNISSDTVSVKYDTSSLSAGPTIEICKQQDTVLSATPGFSDYQWQPASAINGNAQAQNIFINPSQTTIYFVTAQSAANCTLTDSVKVIVENCLNKLIMPNAFTPNGDGINDIIEPKVYGVLIKYDLEIYNRWGRMVFHSTKPNDGWNGKINGVLQMNGAYVWLCHYQFTGDAEKTSKGTFVLIK